MRVSPRLLAGIFALTSVAAPLGAQVASGPDSLFVQLASAQRAEVTRAELEASLAEIERILASDGYSSALKDQKRAEAEAIRTRLAEGDIRPSDVIRLAVAGHEDLSGVFTVTNDRTIVLPGAGEISVRGLLRSEVEDHLRTQMRRFVRDPIVRADAQIRISLFGGVQRQGFYVVPASLPITDVIMTAGGGPSGNQKLEDSKILRGDRVIVDEEEFTRAVREARSLDQLNIQAGDEIRVGQRRMGPLPILGVLSAVGSVSYLITRLF